MLQPTRGHLLLDGEPAHLTDPVTSLQEGNRHGSPGGGSFDTLSVAENMAHATGLPTHALGLFRWGKVYRRAQQAVKPLGEAFGEGFDVRQPASSLSVAERHLTQVAAAVVEKARIVILDEPTSVLTLSESEWLFDQIDRLKTAGVGIGLSYIFASTRGDLSACRQNQCASRWEARLVWAQIFLSIPTASGPSDGGSPHGPTNPPSPLVLTVNVPVRLRVRGLSDRVGSFRDVDLEISAGEVFGLYGLIGSGENGVVPTPFSD